jgi:hypothetical protein
LSLDSLHAEQKAEPAVVRADVHREAVLHLYDESGALWIFSLASDGSTTVTPPSHLGQSDLPWAQVLFPLEEMQRLATLTMHVCGTTLHLPTTETRSSP